eukprot:138520_1
MSLLQSSTQSTGQNGAAKIEKPKKKKKFQIFKRNKDKDDEEEKGDPNDEKDLAGIMNGFGIAYKNELCGGGKGIATVTCAEGCNCKLAKNLGTNVGSCVGTCPTRQEMMANVEEIVYSDGLGGSYVYRANSKGTKARVGYYDYQSQDLYGVPHFNYNPVQSHALGYSPQIYDAMPVLIVAVMMAFVCVCVICSGIAAFGCVGCYSFGRKQAEAERQKKADYEELTV